MRGLGTLYRQCGSRFWWMQYFAAGRRFRESTKCERQREAQDVLQSKLAQLRHSPLSDGPGSTVAGLYVAIEREYATNGRKSLSHLKSLWKNHLSKFFADLAAGDVHPDHVSEYVRDRQAAGAANASINRELSALKRMYRLALKAQKIKVVPYIAMLEERNVRKGFLRDSQYEALARETARIGLWLEALFELAYRYGWRKSELTEMRVGQLDLLERTIELNPGETKNDEGRIVVMTSRIHELLSRCVAGKASAELVFTREDGRGAGNFRRAWAKATEAAGVPGLLFHDLRRSGVRNMRRLGIPEKVAMTISGHKTRAVFERYNIVDPSDLKAAVARMETALQMGGGGEMN
jgi:integrase